MTKKLTKAQALPLSMHVQIVAAIIEHRVGEPFEVDDQIYAVLGLPETPAESGLDDLRVGATVNTAKHENCRVVFCNFLTQTVTLICEGAYLMTYTNAQYDAATGVLTGTRQKTRTICVASMDSLSHASVDRMEVDETRLHCVSIASGRFDFTFDQYNDNIDAYVRPDGHMLIGGVA